MKFKDIPDKPIINNPEDINKIVDTVLQGQSPSEQQRLKDNRRFIKDITENPLPDKKSHVKVFGVKDININAILKDNIWNRGIFTTDHLCRVVFQLRYEQIKKWLSQKRKKPFEHWMLVLIIIGVVIALVVILILMNVNLSKVFG